MKEINYRGFIITKWFDYGQWWYIIDTHTFSSLDDAKDYIERNYLR